MEKTKILIVDDNEGVVLILQMLLEHEGYEVLVAKDGREGYSAYIISEPDLVITDIHLPIRSGIELIHLIRHHNPGIRTIYMSGDPGMFRAALEEEKGRYHAWFLPKPFSKNDLIKTISECSG